MSHLEAVGGACFIELNVAVLPCRCQHAAVAAGGERHHAGWLPLNEAAPVQRYHARRGLPLARAGTLVGAPLPRHAAQVTELARWLCRGCCASQTSSEHELKNAS
jgi:hypothetical protein